MKKTFTRLFMLVLLTMMSGWASAESVTFNVCSWDDTNKKVVTTQQTKDGQLLEGSHPNDWVGLSDGYYVVKGTVEYKALSITGSEAHLVLCDGATLKCAHIKLEEGHTLHIHSQSDGDQQGKLETVNRNAAKQSVFDDAAAIGGGNEKSMGNLFIHGGDILAQGAQKKASYNSNSGAAIGGGYKGGIGLNSQLVIYGGKVSAIASLLGAGIGGGYKAHQGGPIMVYGGSVKAEGGGMGAAIGGGYEGNGGVVKIYDGRVEANMNNPSLSRINGAGIGGGRPGSEEGAGGQVYIYGGETYAKGGSGAAGIGGAGSGKCGTLEMHGGYLFAAGSSAPAIGGGHTGKGGTVIINGGTVCAAKNKGSISPIGGGLDDKPNGTLDLATGLRVFWGTDASLVSNPIHEGSSLNWVEYVDKRKEACQNRSYSCVLIEPCEHNLTVHNYRCIDKNTHVSVCKQCAHYDVENHTFTDGKCVCGKKYDESEIYYKLNIHQTTDGKTYTSEEQKVVQGKEFMLPVPQSLSGLTFMGYLKATSADGIEMKDSEEGTLLEGGSTITPDANATYYARYRYIYDEEWTWNANGTEAEVKITNERLNFSKELPADITEDTEQRVEPTETSLGERYLTGKATYEHDGVTYQFYDHVTQFYYPDTNAKITLDAQATDNANTKALENYIDMKADVTINNLTLKKDGKIHPICLPFYASVEDDTPLKGAVIYKLSGAQLKDHEFTMTFKQGLTTVPGIPCFYRFKETGADVQNPEFKNVVIEEYYGLIAEKEYDASTWSADDESLELWGAFEPESIDEENRELYFLMDGDGISLKPTTLNAFGSYFYIASPTDEEGNSRVRSVSLAFESGDKFSKKLTWSWDGDGSKTLPYIIKNAEQLSEMSEAMNGTDAAALEGKFFRQDANITFDKGTENNYTPVKTLKAHYDGNGFVISGLNINATGSNNAALFLSMADGTVKNVIVRNSTITGSQAAAIATTLTGTASIENCHVLKDVEVRSNYYYAGGVVAQMQSGTPTVTDCSNQAAVISNQGYAGGVVGWVTNGSVSNSIYLGNSITHGDGKQSYAVAGGNAGITVEDCYYTCPTLSDANAKLMPQYNADNTDFLMMVNKRDKYLKTGKTDLADADISYDITLNGHTLYKDGTWNTLCLPFSVETFSGTPLEGATVKQLTKSNYWQDKNQLELIFNNVDRATGGYLYFVKWTGGDNVTSPTFSGVIIYPYSDSPHADYVDQYGTFKPVTLEADDKTVLYLGADNKLYYPKSAVTINSFHGYLKLQSNLVMGDLAAGVRSIELNFGEDGTTSINEELRMKNEEFATATGWYTLDGKKLQGKPTQKGVYIVNGRKVVIK